MIPSCNILKKCQEWCIRLNADKLKLRIAVPYIGYLLTKGLRPGLESY